MRLAALLIIISSLLLLGCTAPEYNGPGAQCTTEDFCAIGLACVDGTCQPNTQPIKNATQEALVGGVGSTTKFTVTVPEITPPEDTIYLQFRSGKIVPMTEIAPNVHSVETTVPLAGSSYAYTRMGVNYESSEALPPEFDLQSEYTKYRTPEGSEINDVVEEWRWWTVDPATYTYPQGTKPFAPRVDNEPFQDGIAIIDYWWTIFYDNGATEKTIDEIKQDNAGWIEISPTWRIREEGDTVSLWKECGYCYPEKAIRFETKAAQDAGFKVIWRFQVWQAKELNTTGRSDGWWHSLSDTNRQFILESAALAEELGVEATAVGAEYNSLTRALLSDEAPDFVREEWIQAIRDAKETYSGKLYYDLNNNAPATDTGSLSWQYERVKDVIAETDFIGISWWQAIADNCDPTLEEMETNFGRIADKGIKPIYEETGKPVVLISLAIMSVDCGGMGNSIYAYDAREIDIWKPDDGVTPNDMNEQALAYEAVLRGIADRPFITGLYSFGYWRQDMQDKQWNIRGKPAQLVVRKWYAEL